MSFPYSWTDEERQAWAEGGPGCDRCRQAAVIRLRDHVNSLQEQARSLISKLRAAPSSHVAHELASLPVEILSQTAAFTAIFAAVFAAARQYPYEKVTARTSYEKHAFRSSSFKIEINSREPLAQINSAAACDSSGHVFKLRRESYSFSETRYNYPSTIVSVILTAGDVPQLQYRQGTPPDRTLDGTFPSHVCTNGLSYATENVTDTSYLSSLLKPAASLL